MENSSVSISIPPQGSSGPGSTSGTSLTGGLSRLSATFGGRRSKVNSISPAPASSTMGSTIGVDRPRAPIVPDATVSPYSFFFPGRILRETKLDESSSKKSRERETARDRKLAFIRDEANLMPGGHNLSITRKACQQHLSQDGTLTKEGFTEAMLGLGVTDEEVVERTYCLFEGDKSEGRIDFKEVMSALDVIINGVNKNVTCQDCFSLFDPTGCGYIIRDSLAEMKIDGREDVQGINHLMVRTIVDIIDTLRDEDADRFKKDWLRKFKRRKGKKQKEPLFKKAPGPNSHTNKNKGKDAKKKKKAVVKPVQVQPKIHLSYDEFCEQMSLNPQLVQAFLGRILTTMESVYKRNKKSTGAHSSLAPDFSSAPVSAGGSFVGSERGSTMGLTSAASDGPASSRVSLARHPSTNSVGSAAAASVTKG